MILLTAVICGGFTGWGIARWQGRTWLPPILQYPGLIFFGFLPQWVAFYFSPTSRWLPDEAASAALIFSQIVLLWCAWLNRSLAGMPVLMIGLGCNLAVILANGGFMPLPLEAAARLVSQDVLDSLVLGERISHASKDVLLQEASIRLPWLADRFTSPSFLPYRVAYSMGDILIAIGAFLLLVREREISQKSNRGDAS